MKRAFLQGKDPKNIPKEEWKKQLTEEEYRVTRQAQTEAPFTGKFEKHFKQGKYVCNCCGAELFVSETKYDAECGWPSFFASSKAAGKKPDANISRRPDNSIPNRPRTEVRCNKCDAHLGHVFQEEPTPTGERYCINSVAIDFESDVGVKEGSTTEEVTECDGKEKGQVSQPTTERLKDKDKPATSTEKKQDNKKKAEDEKKDKS